MNGQNLFGVLTTLSAVSGTPCARSATCASMSSIALLALLVGLLLRISPVEFAVIFLAVLAVLTAEMFNTVLEICVDLASPAYHPLAKIAKDVAAGAVLISAILSVLIGLCIFLPHIFALLHW